MRFSCEPEERLFAALDARQTGRPKRRTAGGTWPGGYSTGVLRPEYFGTCEWPAPGARATHARTTGPWADQLVLTAVSSMTNEVCSEMSSAPVNLSVTVCPAKLPSE